MALSFLIACDGPDHSSPFRIIGADDEAAAYLSSLINFVTSIAPAPLATDNYAITVLYSIDDVTAACGDTTEQIRLRGCADVAGQTINVLWRPEDYARVDNALVMAHELGHLFYSEHGDINGDPNHTHTEWFNVDLYTPDTIEGQVFATFGP